MKEEVRRIRKRITACALAVLLLFGMAAPLKAEEESGKTTLMIYMIGSDLESKMGAATDDLKEMTESGVDTGSVNLVVCAGGTSKWQGDLGDTEKLSLLHLTDNGFEQDGTMPLASMGDAETLASFINDSVKKYPAEHYALIFWDHGNGPVMGYGKDILFDKDALTLSEMREAMDKTAFAKDLKLDWVGFDACLMASAELACVWSSYADYLVSSQEVEPGFGWYYAFLKDMGKVPAEELTRSIADSYMAFTEEKIAEKNNYNPEVTLSVLDLSHAEKLEETVNALFKTAAADVSGDYTRLALARVNTRGIGRASTGSEYDLVDLQTAAEQLSEEYPKQSVAVLDVLKDFVVYSVSNTPQCCGVNLYYPYYNKSYYKKSWNDTYRDLGIFPDYLTYLERYDKIWLGTDMQDYFEGSMELSEGASASTYTLQLTEEQAAVYAKSNYYILRREAEDLYSIVYCCWDVTEKKGKLTAEFDGNILYFETDFGHKGIPFTLMYDTVDGVTDYKAMNMLLTRGDINGHGDDSMETEIRFSVDKETGEMEIKGIFPVDEEAFSGGRQEPVDLSEWDVIRFYMMTPHYLSRDESGRLKYYWEWPEHESILWNELPVADNPTFRFEPLYADGYEYFIIINVMDVQGNLYSSELFPIVPAAAPEAGPHAEAEHVSWDGGNEVTLLDADDLTVGLAVAKDVYSGQDCYFLTGENRNDYPVTVSIGGKYSLINGKINGDSYATLYLDPGENRCQVVSGLTKNLMISGQKRPDTLLFDCRIYRRDNDATLYDGMFEVGLSGNIKPEAGWAGVLSASAEEQVLLSEDGVTISLLGLGIPKDSSYTGRVSTIDNMTAAFAVENESGSAAEVEISGLIINGVYLDSGWSFPFTLPDKTCWYGHEEKSIETVMALGDFYREIRDPEDGSTPMISSVDEMLRLIDKQPEGGLPWITSISSLSVVVSINGKFYTCPVELSEKGDQEPFSFEGKTIYQDDAVEIRLYSVEKGEDYSGEDTYTWYFWIISKAGSGMNLYLYPSESDPSDRDGFFDYYTFYNTGPDSAVLAEFSAGRAEGTEHSVKLVDFMDGSSYETKPFVLKAE